jgi:hypothetical protein
MDSRGSQSAFRGAVISDGVSKRESQNGSNGVSECEQTCEQRCWIQPEKVVSIPLESP